MEATTNRDAVIGVDLGGTKLMAGLFDADDQLIAQERIEVGGMDQHELVDALAGVVTSFAAQTDLPVVAAGFGLPTTIDQRTGVAVQAANLPIADLPVRDILRERTGIDIFLDNDANVAALAEQRLGAGAGTTGDLIMVTLGTGFGGGIVCGGRIISGAIGAGAELGHMSIAYDGLPCVSPNCPGIGCIETYAGGRAMMREAAALVEREPDGALARAVAAGEPAAAETMVRLTRAGDAACAAVIERMGQHLGAAFVNFVNIFNPGMIVVGGGFTPALDLLLPTARDVVTRQALRPGNTYVEIVEATFGSDAGMIGAGLLARIGAREMQAV